MKQIHSLLMTGALPENSSFIRLFSQSCPLSENCLRAGSLEKGLSLLRSHPVDLLFLDMSAGSGLPADSPAQIRQRCSIPIIMITGGEEGLPSSLSQERSPVMRLCRRSAFSSVRQYHLRISLEEEAEQKQSLKEKMEALLQQSSHALAVMDGEGRLCFANAAACSFLGSIPAGSHFELPSPDGQPLEISLLHFHNRGQAADSHDQLTGLYSRTYFEKNLPCWDIPDNLPLGLITGHADHLALSAGILGEQYSRCLLTAVTDAAEKICSPEDLLFRWNDDEFLILLPRCTEPDIQRVIGRMQEACSALEADGMPASLSLGYAVKYEMNQSVPSLLGHAEKEMHSAGQNRQEDPDFCRAALEKLLHQKDAVTAEHALRVRDACLCFARYLGLDKKTARRCSLVASLHDIGKMAIPSSILDKEGPLDKSEWETMRHHPSIGFCMIKDLPGMYDVAEGILSHHERWDGQGYPRKLAGSKIPLTARILSLVDAFDAMTHDRPYRKAMDRKEALHEIRRCRGTQFDPDLSDAFIQFIQKKFP